MPLKVEQIRMSSSFSGPSGAHNTHQLVLHPQRSSANSPVFPQSQRPYYRASRSDSKPLWRKILRNRALRVRAILDIFLGLFFIIQEINLELLVITAVGSTKSKVLFQRILTFCKVRKKSWNIIKICKTGMTNHSSSVKFCISQMLLFSFEQTSSITLASS